MPEYKKATTFSLHSLDHDQTLLSQESSSIRHLLATEDVQQTPEQIKLNFEVEGEQFEFVLNKGEGSIKNDAMLSEIVDGELVSNPMPMKFHSYKSEAKNARLNFIDHQKAEGLITKENGVRYHIIIENGEMSVDQNINAYFQSEEFKQNGQSLRNLEYESEYEAANLQNIDYWSGCHAGQGGNRLTYATLGNAIGSQMFASYGQTTSLNMVNNYIDLSNDIYENQMDVTLATMDVFISRTANDAPFNSAGCRTNIQTQLTRFRSWNKPSNQVLWQLYDDCFGFSGSTLGIAYLRALCESFNVGVNYLSENRISTVSYPTWTTVAHEIGHNFAAQHSFEQGQGNTGGIMDYGPANGKLINGVMQFNTRYRRTEVCNHVDLKVRQGCLYSGQEIQELSLIDTGYAKTVDDCQMHRNRVFAVDNSNVLERVSGVTVENCDIACASGADCAGFTFAEDTGLCKLYSGVTEADMAYTVGFESYICTTSTRSFTDTQTVDDLLVEEDVNELKEACCEVNEKMGFLGMNEAALPGLTMEECQAACIQASECENAVYTYEHDCLFYGVNEMDADAIEPYHDASMTSMSCDRTCLNSFVVSTSSNSSTEIDTSTTVGLTFGIAGVLAVGLAAYYYKSR